MEAGIERWGNKKIYKGTSVFNQSSYAFILFVFYASVKTFFEELCCLKKEVNNNNNTTKNNKRASGGRLKRSALLLST